MFRRPPRRRSFEDVTEQIRERIQQGALREGDRLPPERDLAATFNVSRNTIREALRALEHSGLLALEPGATGGAFIRNSGAEVMTMALGDQIRLGLISVANLTEARTIIGSETARLACERRSEADMIALTENVRLMEEAAAAGNLPLRVNRNLEFHKLLARAAGNPVLVVITEALVESVREFVHAIGAMPNEFAIASRRRMLDHLRRRDGNGAAEEMTSYLKMAQTDYLERFRPPGKAGGIVKRN
jgi:DNA-binding FadR family transcriptional regulator